VCAVFIPSNNFRINRKFLMKYLLNNTSIGGTMYSISWHRVSLYLSFSRQSIFLYLFLCTIYLCIFQFLITAYLCILHFLGAVYICILQFLFSRQSISLYIFQFLIVNDIKHGDRWNQWVSFIYNQLKECTGSEDLILSQQTCVKTYLGEWWCPLLFLKKIKSLNNLRKLPQ